MHQPYPGIAIGILTISDTKSAIARRSRPMTASQVTSSAYFRPSS